MNQLEQRWLTRFVTDYQRVMVQIECHENLRDELLSEMRRVDDELLFLNKEKEHVLTTFAEVMLRDRK
ncbi:MAG: hypothetical protein IKT98_09275 [Selenomonadaceae bacterium]|nr:hypothetical protein [Selenomonadaceae bacterium]